MTCTNLGTGATYPCTPEQYDQMNAADEPYIPGYDECHNKQAPATLAECSAAGYPWGRTRSEMRQHDANGATCATGSQLYWVEHSCRVVRQTPNSTSYSDGSSSTP